MKLPFDEPSAIGRPFISLRGEIAAAILRTISSGWEIVLNAATVSRNSGEVEITEQLRDGMRAALDGGSLRWRNRIIILPGTESRSRSDLAIPDGRTDIPVMLIEIFPRYGEHDPHAIIECKRVAGSASRLCNEYVQEGIGRFRTGKYGANHAAGFMIGYLVLGDCDAAVTELNRRISRIYAPEEKLSSSLIVPESWVRQSRHLRANCSTIELRHAFLPFHSRKRTV